ncbi:hypothetical protein MPPM_2915 [Methylorubrum populi]|uniref:DUF2336 domain-containing protein n=1 Tax=Methylorubrum populi TaxID=223967 RepID=A0A160PIL0_9HYPH|nr:DUF2336 domain-containing protein [Methylorubrum populi]BAU91520.1 hypothetical protein MPPM_2915 [Methylorubrum populi]
MVALHSVVAEVEGAIASGDPAKRVSMLRRMTSLFTTQAPRLNEDQVGAFDQVILRLSRDIETRARADLAANLADVANAPRHVVRDLAYDASAEVAGPVLERSLRLDESDLIQIASGAGQQHLMALSRRSALAERVTDVIVSRGDEKVVRSVAGNRGAQFSLSGFQILTTRAERDVELEHTLAERVDVPAAQRSQLIAMARERARRTLATEFGASAAERATLAIAESLAAPPVDLTPIEVAVARQAKVELDETNVQEWLSMGQTNYALVALARFAGVPSVIALNAHMAPTTDPLLFLVRSARFGWKTLKLFLASRSDGEPNADDMQSAFQSFQELSVATAQRVVRFTAAREKLEQSTAA